MRIRVQGQGFDEVFDELDPICALCQITPAELRNAIATGQGIPTAIGRMWFTARATPPSGQHERQQGRRRAVVRSDGRRFASTVEATASVTPKIQQEQPHLLRAIREGWKFHGFTWAYEAALLA